jgi:hypothetical protein
LGPAVEAVYSPSIDPVEDVEESVQAKGSNVVGSDVFNYSHLVKHNDLWNESKTLKPETVTPYQFPWAPS